MNQRANIIAGIHPVEEALEAKAPLHAIYIAKDKKNRRIEKIKRTAKELGVKVVEVPPIKLNEMSPTKHQGIVAVISEIRFTPLEELINLCKKERSPLLVVLDGVTDVGNAGAIVRSAEVLGASGVIISERNSPLFGEAMAKASAGAIWHIPISRVKSLTKAVDRLKEEGFWIACTHTEKGTPVDEFDFNLPLAVIFGSESKGVRRVLQEKADFFINIPQKGRVSSLNVSVAAGIILYFATTSTR